MFRLPPVAPSHFYAHDASYNASTQKSHTDSLFVSETGCLRFARDYGLSPYACSHAQVRAIFQATHKKKLIVSSRLPTREQVQSRTPSLAKSELSAKTKKAE